MKFSYQIGLIFFILLINAIVIWVGWKSAFGLQWNPDGTTTRVGPQITSDVLTIPVALNITLPFLPIFLYHLNASHRVFLLGSIVALFGMIYLFLNTPSLIPRKLSLLNENLIGYVFAILVPLIPAIFGKGYAQIYLNFQFRRQNSV